MYKVYKHTNVLNGKVYIGITSLSLNNRWRNGEGYKNCTLFYKAIKKYGWDNFTHEVLFDGLSKEEAEKAERNLIQAYQSNNKSKGYNIENGGNSRGKMSEEEKAKRSIRFSGENNPMYGVRRFGCNNPMYGKHWTDEHKKRHSDLLKGRFAKEKNPMYGKHHTEEFKRKISEMESGKNNPRARAVRCIDTNIVYETTREASEKTGVNFVSINQCCLGNYKTAGGLHWEYAGGA